jgi:DNA-binding response OmpR family regulator
MKKILVVDDETNIQLLFKTELETCGYQVECCSSIHTLRSIFPTFKPDLIVLDIMLEGDEDGITFLEQFRSEGHDTLVVIMTAYEKYQQNFKSWAADEFLVKSNDTQALINTIKRLIG